MRTLVKWTSEVEEHAQYSAAELRPLVASMSNNVLISNQAGGNKVQIHRD